MYVAVSSPVAIAVAEQHPLKQGLKHGVSGRVASDCFVAEQHPLKQGLKHVIDSDSIDAVKSRRAASTKTRIETHRG